MRIPHLTLGRREGAMKVGAEQCAHLTGAGGE